MNVEQWRHIPSKENPADAASCGLSVKAFLHCQTWEIGPHFLKTDTEVKQEDDPEVKQEVSIHVTAVQSTESCPTMLLCYFLRWIDFKQAVAWILKIKMH